MWRPNILSHMLQCLPHQIKLSCLFVSTFYNFRTSPLPFFPFLLFTLPAWCMDSHAELFPPKFTFFFTKRRHRSFRLQQARVSTLTNGGKWRHHWPCNGFHLANDDKGGVLGLGYVLRWRCHFRILDRVKYVLVLGFTFSPDVSPGARRFCTVSKSNCWLLQYAALSLRLKHSDPVVSAAYIYKPEGIQRGIHAR